jgi:hypothetical protein
MLISLVLPESACVRKLLSGLAGAFLTKSHMYFHETTKRAMPECEFAIGAQKTNAAV